MTGQPMDDPSVRNEYLTWQQERINRAIDTGNGALLLKVIRELRAEGFEDLANGITASILTALIKDANAKEDFALTRKLIESLTLFFPKEGEK